MNEKREETAALKKDLDERRQEGAAQKKKLDNRKREGAAQKKELDESKLEAIALKEELDERRQEGAAQKKELDESKLEEIALKEELDERRQEGAAQRKVLDTRKQEGATLKKELDERKQKGAAQKKVPDTRKQEGAALKKKLDERKQEGTALKKEEMGNNDQLFRKGEKAARLSTAILIALSAVKLIIALISGSIALLSDSIHSFADIFSVMAVWIGLKLIQRKPSERFPYGYFKAENFALLVVSSIIVVSGVLIIIEAVDKLSQPSGISFPLSVFVVTALSGVASFILGRYKKKVGKATGSQSLIGEGQHSLMDVYVSIVVFIGVFFSTIGFFIVEILAGLAIGVFVIVVGVVFGKDAILSLMDVSINPERIEEIKQIAKNVQGVSGVHAVRLRKAGPVSFGEIHVEVQDDIPIDKGHAISTEVEEKIKERFKDVESITIHIGRPRKDKITLGIPTLEDRGLESVTSEHFATAPFFTFVEVNEDRLLGTYSKVNTAVNLSRKKGIVAAQLLVDEKVDVAIVGDIGDGPFHLLNDNFVQIYSLHESMKVEAVVDQFRQRIFKRMMTPTDKSSSHHHRARKG
jgi:cation diffusion facilitator family transporter